MYWILLSTANDLLAEIIRAAFAALGAAYTLNYRFLVSSNP